MEGSGRMIVTAVGISSQSGIIMSLIHSTSSEKQTDENEIEGSFWEWDCNLFSALYSSNGEQNNKIRKKVKISKRQSKINKLIVQMGYAGLNSEVLEKPFSQEQLLPSSR